MLSAPPHGGRMACLWAVLPVILATGAPFAAGTPPCPQIRWGGVGRAQGFLKARGGIVRGAGELVGRGRIVLRGGGIAEDVAGMDLERGREDEPWVKELEAQLKQSVDEEGKPLSKNEIKRKLKAARVEREREEKKAAKVQDAFAPAGDFDPEARVHSIPTADESASKRLVGEEEELDPRLYYENRCAAVTSMEVGGMDVYPHKFATTLSVLNFRAKYEGWIEDGEHILETTEKLAGRVLQKRAQGKLVFLELIQSGHKVQIMATEDNFPSAQAFWDKMQRIKRGDIIGADGFPGMSKRGELSLFARNVTLLAPCLHMLPKKGLKDLEIRYRQRYLDLILHPENRGTFVTRSRVIQMVRRFLDDRGFLEVETPILNTVAGGATARPFTTHHNELNIDMHLRIAPELFLKQLVIGGLDRVYEIGRLFRNEGIDQTHNPEFTTCEFYEAYADYYDLMETTEEMISEMVLEITGNYTVTLPCGDEVSFKPPFARVSMLDALENATGTKLPADLESGETQRVLEELCKTHNVECPAPKTPARLLDKLVGDLVEKRLTQPTFLMDHPIVMSPLAKTHRSRPGLTERFELFIGGMEYCNAYTELNNPFVQRERFRAQAVAKAGGDAEAQSPDEDFCRALDYGLPPTAGWGLGIDRFTMLLTGQYNIKEVLLFPAMKPLEL